MRALFSVSILGAQKSGQTDNPHKNKPIYEALKSRIFVGRLFEKQDEYSKAHFQKQDLRPYPTAPYPSKNPSPDPTPCLPHLTSTSPRPPTDPAPPQSPSDRARRRHALSALCDPLPPPPRVQLTGLAPAPAYPPHIPYPHSPTGRQRKTK